MSIKQVLGTIPYGMFFAETETATFHDMRVVRKEKHGEIQLKLKFKSFGNIHHAALKAIQHSHRNKVKENEKIKHTILFTSAGAESQCLKAHLELLADIAVDLAPTEVMTYLHSHGFRAL